MAIGDKYTRKGTTKCNRKVFAKRMREVRAIGKPEKDLIPLWKHVINLARDSISRGACKRAGRELLHAKRLATKYPGRR